MFLREVPLFLVQICIEAADFSLIQQNGTIASAAGTGIHDPKAVLHLFAVGLVSVAEEENICASFSCLQHGQMVAAFHVPQMPMGEENFFAFQRDQPGGDLHGPAVAVARYADQRNLRIDISDFLGIPLKIAQVDDGIRSLVLDHIKHVAQSAVGVGKNKNFQNGHLIPLVAYTGL